MICAFKYFLIIMLGNSNPPETLLSNESSHHQTSNKKISQKDDELIHTHEVALQKTMTSSKDPNTQNRAFQYQNRTSFRQKLKVLKKKKDSLKNTLKNIDRGPKRIMSKCLTKYRRQTEQDNRQNFKSQEQNSDFESQQQGYENYTGPNGLQQNGGGEQNSSYKLNGSKNQLLKKRTFRFHANAQLIFPISEGFKYHYSIIRKQEGTKYFYPEFQLIDEQKQVAIYCKKIGMFEFAYTLRYGQWSQDYQSYIGKLVSNISGSVLNLFIKITCKQKIEERIICSIQYKNSYLSFKKPRKLQVFMLNLTKTNIEDKKYQKISSLRQIYETDKSSSSICYFENKYPTYNKIDKVYSLDFHGRAPICSVKNFILEQPVHKGREYLLFGKREENAFNIDFMHPFSMLTAFGVCISSFNGKIICE